MKFILLFGLFLLILPFSAQAEDIIDGDLIRADLDVYIVKLINGKQFKRLVLNPEIFNKYGHLTWDMIKNVNQSVVDQYSVTDLVRAVDDDKIYKLYPNGDIGEKRWITTTDVFLDLGYDWDAVYNINSFERDFYIQGDDLVADVIIELEPEPEPEPEPELTRDPITINVPGDYSTIQAAIDAAIDGDTISVGRAIYTENIVLNKNIELIGSGTAAVINGTGNGPAITINGVNDFLIQRFTIKSENNKGIYCLGSDLSEGTIKNVVLKDSAWGVYVEGNCTLNLFNNLIYNNQNSLNTDGAGVLVKNVDFYDSFLDIRNNTIDDNYHGIWTENIGLNVVNNIFSRNSGGDGDVDNVALYHNGQGTLNINYNVFWNNTYNADGNVAFGDQTFFVDPKFVNVYERNYSLVTGTSNYSFCIDTGNPSVEYNDGRLITSNLYRGDIGAYGGPDNTGWTP